jgi:DNA-nicking Smr family endonuclease
MKKSKKPPAKPKEFASRPFTSLKGVRTEAGAGESKVVPAPAPKPEVPVADADLFLRTMADVKRLNPEKPAGPGGKSAPPLAKRIEEEERHVFFQALEQMNLDVRFEDTLPDDVEPRRPLPVNRLRQLKRGAIRIDLELDLHGLTREEALVSLGRFITGAFNRGQRAVLVITGKGLNSPVEPVLQGAVAGWLRDKGKGMVAEFAPAPRQMGGSGAFVVFLKEKTVDPGLGTRDSDPNNGPKD